MPVPLRPAVSGLPAYVAGKPAPEHPDRVTYKLSSNENPFPPLPGVLEDDPHPGVPAGQLAGRPVVVGEEEVLDRVLLPPAAALHRGSGQPVRALRVGGLAGTPLRRRQSGHR